MSISDMIVVMKDGVVQQIGEPQAVYDAPVNLFVAQFLGTPPISVFEGRVEKESLYVGESRVLSVKGVADGSVSVGVRPEGFVLDPAGALSCTLSGVEVMGRDVSIVSTHPASLNPTVRAIVPSDSSINVSDTVVRFSLKPQKTHLFDKATGARIPFES